MKVFLFIPLFNLIHLIPNILNWMETFYINFYLRYLHGNKISIAFRIAMNIRSSSLSLYQLLKWNRNMTVGN